MSKTRMSTLLGGICLGLLAGCVSRTTIREKERVRSEPRVEERTVIVPQPSVREETTVIEKRHHHEED